jgi:hypothetical protein
MILIDCVFVFSKGGLNVMNSIISSIAIVERKEFVLVLDSRHRNLEIDTKGFFQVYYIKKGLLRRQLNFWNHKNISVVFSLGNIPLLNSQKSKYQLTYNMQYLIFDFSMLNFKNRTIWFLKSSIIKFLFWLSNTDVSVQTDSMKNLFETKIKLKASKIFNFPIFKEINKPAIFNLKSNRFVYLSSGLGYKKVDFLLDAFERHQNDYPDSTLTLTIDKEHQKTFNRIENLKAKGHKIFNKGFVNQEEAHNLLKENYILIHPSVVESFGIVLLEAAFNGNAIIAPDLQYVKDVCEPSAFYQSDKLDSLVYAMSKSAKKKLVPAKPKIKDMSRPLVEFLISKNANA